MLNNMNCYVKDTGSDFNLGLLKLDHAVFWDHCPDQLIRAKLLVSDLHCG